MSVKVYSLTRIRHLSKRKKMKKKKFVVTVLLNIAVNDSDAKKSVRCIQAHVFCSLQPRARCNQTRCKQYPPRNPPAGSYQSVSTNSSKQSPA